eukprot:5929551-Amphidinium_carterae.1
MAEGYFDLKQAARVHSSNGRIPGTIQDNGSRAGIVSQTRLCCRALVLRGLSWRAFWLEVDNLTAALVFIPGEQQRR